MPRGLPNPAEHQQCNLRDALSDLIKSFNQTYLTQMPSPLAHLRNPQPPVHLQKCPLSSPAAKLTLKSRNQLQTQTSPLHVLLLTSTLPCMLAWAGKTNYWYTAPASEQLRPGNPLASRPCDVQCLHDVPLQPVPGTHTQSTR